MEKIASLLSSGTRAALLALVAVASAASAQTYPSHPVTLIVPGPPGGITDQLGRLVATRVGERLGQTILVDNKAGAGGNIAAEAAAKAAPDGYTLFMGTQGTQATNEFLYKGIRFDPRRDFAPVHALIAIPNILVANSARPYQTVKELVDYAKQNPGKVTVSSAGSGTGTHLAAELFQAVAGVKFVHVPYKGSAPSINDLLGGQIDITFDYPITTLGHVQAGKLRALAVTGPSRLPALPNVPTIAEAGYPQAQSTSWIGLFFPAKTPPAVVERWQAELERVLHEATFAEAVGRMGGVPLMLSGAKFGTFVDEERVKWKATIQRSGAKVD